MKTEANHDAAFNIDAATIDARVKELGAMITKDYCGKNPLFVCVLKGAVVFFSDLMRAVETDINMDFVRASSYGQGAQSSGVVTLTHDRLENVAGRHIIIVEDISDSGRTLQRLKAHYLEDGGAASVRLAVLLDKPDRREVDVDIDYLGFTIPDEFIVGYGLDCAEQYRNLPFITTIDQAREMTQYERSESNID